MIVVLVKVVVILGVVAIPFYQLVTSIAEDDPYPVKTTNELLDGLESPIVEPGS